MNWLREHMGAQVGLAPSRALRQDVSTFPSDGAPTSRHDTASVLGVVPKTAAVISGIPGRAAESESRAKAPAKIPAERANNPRAVNLTGDESMVELKITALVSIADKTSLGQAYAMLRSGLRSIIVTTLLGSALAGCVMVGPDYVRPPAPVPFSDQFKEQKGWKVATPIDVLDRGPWWCVYKDRRLDDLEAQVVISNENVKAAAAAYEQARAIIREAQANLLPNLGSSYSVVRNHSGPRANNNYVTNGSYNTVYTTQATGTWSPDLWGQIRRQIESDVAGAQASAADLANATLSAQAMLAVAYFNLMATDSLKALLDKTIVGYKGTLKIVKDHFQTGTVSRADLVAAETQLYNAETQAINTGIQRAQLEHAIAVLIGRPPAELSISRGSLAANIPNIPIILPSELLERRPDVAAAERLMQEQNALIGAAVAAYFPNITISGNVGLTGHIPLPYNVAHSVWSLGATASQTIFDGGSRGAQVDAARALYWQSVANYRQTVLTAFEQVEDQLAAVRILTEQLKVATLAVNAAQKAVDIYGNQYRAGVINYTTLFVAQQTLLGTQQAALLDRQNLFVASVLLIEALGGGWDVLLLPTEKALVRSWSLLPQLY